MGGDVAGSSEALATVGPKSGAAGPKPGREKGGKARLGECFWVFVLVIFVANLLNVVECVWL